MIFFVFKCSGTATIWPFTIGPSLKSHLKKEGPSISPEKKWAVYNWAVPQIAKKVGRPRVRPGPFWAVDYPDESQGFVLIIRIPR